MICLLGLVLLAVLTKAERQIFHRRLPVIGGWGIRIFSEQK